MESLLIRPVFVVLSEDAAADAALWVPQQLARLNSAFAPAGVAFAEDAPVLVLANGNRAIDLEAERASIESMARETLLAAAPAGTSPTDLYAGMMPVYVGKFQVWTAPGSNDRKEVHGYADHWQAENPFSGIWIADDRLPGRMTHHAETDTMQPADGTTAVHEAGHWLADLPHEFTPGKTCVLNPALRGQMNPMDYDADACRNAWTPEQLQTIRAIVRERLNRPRSAQAAFAMRAETAPDLAVIQGESRRSMATNSVLAVVIFGIFFFAFNKIFR